jgi:hypothetical protein
MHSHHSTSSTSMAHAPVSPRRRAAHDAVSVPHKRQKLDHPSNDSGSIAGVTSTSQPTQQANLQKTNSQESEEAWKWFDKANSNLDYGLQNMANYDGTGENNQTR